MHRAYDAQIDCFVITSSSLAFCPTAAFQATGVGPPPLTRLTSSTITGIEGLLKNLEAVRRVGYAFDDQEAEDGVCCIAAPVRIDSERVVAAVSVSVVASQLVSTPSIFTDVFYPAGLQGRRVGESQAKPTRFIQFLNVGGRANQAAKQTCRGALVRKISSLGPLRPLTPHV